MAESSGTPGSEWGASTDMTPREGVMWRAEVDPATRSSGALVEILDCEPDWDRLVAAHEPVSRAIPRLRDRVVEPIVPLVPPAFSRDDTFDVRNHLQHLFAPAVSRLPTFMLVSLAASMTSVSDFQASNIPGLGHTAYLAGAKITHTFPFGPRPGVAAMVTMLSYDGTCCIGFNFDPEAITDTEVFERCMREGFDEVLELRKS